MLGPDESMKAALVMQVGDFPTVRQLMRLPDGVLATTMSRGYSSIAGPMSHVSVKSGPPGQKS